MSKILIAYYSMYGHVHQKAQAVAEGVHEVPGCEAILKRVPETLPQDVLAKMGALEAQKSMAHIPFAESALWVISACWQSWPHVRLGSGLRPVRWRWGRVHPESPQWSWRHRVNRR